MGWYWCFRGRVDWVLLGVFLMILESVGFGCVLVMMGRVGILGILDRDFLVFVLLMFFFLC